MPKFMYTVIAATLIFWYLLISYLSSIEPSSTPVRLVAIVIFYIAVTLSTSLIVFKRKVKKKPKSARRAYRDILKTSAIISTIPALIVGIKILLTN